MSAGTFTVPDCSDQLDQLAAALAAAQGEIGSVSKDSTAKIEMKNGGSYTYRYATLAAVMDAVRGPLAKNGLAIIHTPRLGPDGHMELATRMVHKSGQWASSTLPLMFAGGDMKTMGSALTYARRYNVLNLTGLATDDDDGTAAVESMQRRPENGRHEPPRMTGPAPSRKPATGNGNGKANGKVPPWGRFGAPKNGKQMYGWAKDTNMLGEIKTLAEEFALESYCGDWSAEDVALVVDHFNALRDGRTGRDPSERFDEEEAEAGPREPAAARAARSAPRAADPSPNGGNDDGDDIPF